MDRPNFIELPESNSRSVSALSKNGLPSPRIQHYDGDVPPAMSPLDAIAARSRKLARELEETRKAGERRVSRLAPQIVTESLTEHQNNRPPIFRALSEGADVVPPLPSFSNHFDHSGSLPLLANPTSRPVSQHVLMSAVHNREDSHTKQDPTPDSVSSESKDYFGLTRVESPAPMDPRASQSYTKRSSNPLTNPQFSLSRPDLTLNLAPPRSSSHRLRPYQDASDDDYPSSNAGSTFSQSRNLSSSSGMSPPQSPMSPYSHSHGRTPSSNSLGSPSLGSARNFSRPMSSASMQNLRSEKSPVKSAMSMHLRQTSSFDATNAPRGFMAGQVNYTHSVYPLPRGRNVSEQDSTVFTGLATPHFEWQEPMFPGTPPLQGKKSHELAVPSPLGSARPSREGERSGFSFDLDTENGMTPVSARPSSTTKPSTGLPPPTSHFLPPPAPLSPVEEMSLSSRSNSTIRPTTSRTTSNHPGLAEDHVNKAIELHESGSLKESTYHLRIAANKGHPTGMLLYALACRHGWGMRANPREGVQWLRKAVDSAMHEVAEDEEDTGPKSTASSMEKKAHRAQFGLGIYELGMSHLNGWGTEVDKPLALRCFEIASNWGDTDALTEAGYCYAEGIGCKKDMKKAAKFYRIAESKGVSMIGNSWIHKEKYNDTAQDVDNDRSRSSRKSSAEKPRSKSKSRSIFGKKKPVHT
ncbi:hypothetical protein B0A52_07612 [Exophiala mesophila]|uniref:Cell cycle inhibitor Nif1 n=1 Tax=Exophiala mesophila TaxID=212818 RepID=A0A438MY92_EXOME|nr:hypothetical protein B0A52_07612 [Exophiala mesophila]